MKMYIMKNQKQRIFLMLSFVLFFAIGECGWAGLNQLPQQDTKDNEKLLLALPFFLSTEGLLLVLHLLLLLVSRLRLFRFCQHKMRLMFQSVQVLLSHSVNQ